MYNLVRYAIAFFLVLLFRWRVTGAENIPVSGGVIIASNHISNFDPFVVGTAVSRKLHFMAKEELFVNPVMRAIIQWLGAFPVRRGASDRTAIRTAINLLENGNMVGLFPEGTRSKNGQLRQAEPGLAMIAAKAGATIVPTAVIGTNKFFRDGSLLPQFRVYFGKPIVVKKDKVSKEDLEKITNTMMQEINTLLQKYAK